jgi:hypothetical protein
VHDDADDESELSEIDDNEVEEMEREVRRSAELVGTKSMFPNLMARKSVERVESADTIRVRVPGEKAEGEGR